MSNDFFLKLDGIQGEANEKNIHAGEIEIDDWSFGVNEDDVKKHGSVRTSGGRDNLPVFRPGGDAAVFGQALTGSVRVSDLHFSKRVDIASAPLFKASTTRQKIAKGILVCQKTSGAAANGLHSALALEYLKIQLYDVLVSRWRISAESNVILPTEHFVLSYTRIEFTYQPQGNLGTSAGNMHAGWDRKLNAAM